jgi:tetratricopeptide (TPR) repeat protein
LTFDRSVDDNQKLRRSVTLSTSKRFEVVRCLGEGGMGVVYEALDRERGARVAVKTLRHLTADSLARLKREFRAMQDVQHDNLVTLGDLVSEGDTWSFTMELVEGPDILDYVLARGISIAEESAPPSHNGEGPIALAPTLPFRRAPSVSRFDETRLRASFRQLADALCTLHRANLVHRDVKPSNVRVTPQGRVVLLDFGLVANIAGDHPSMLQLVGTPGYMAPEQAESGRVGPEADWYAVGTMLFEALTGKLPFVGAPLQVLIRKQREEPPPPSSIADGVPPDLDALCVRLTRFDPRQRPSGIDVLRAFGGDVSGGASGARSMTQVAPFVGRTEQLETLAAALAEAKRGEPVAVVVEGESGVGKSALVRRFLEGLATEDSGAAVLSGRCYERESVPFKMFDGIVDSLTHLLARLPRDEVRQIVPARPMALLKVFPVLRRVAEVAEAARGPLPALDPHELRGRAFAALRELLVRLSDRHALVLAVDDAQWADADSFAVLPEIVRPPDPPRMLMVMTVRTSSSVDSLQGAAASPPAQPLDRALAATQSKVVRLGLDRLSDGEARKLASTLLERVGVKDPDVAEWSARQARGHPLFIDMMARMGAELSSDARADIRLEDALWQMVRGLEAVPRAILDIVALAGAPLPQQVVAQASGVEREAFAKGVALLRVAHLAQATGTRGTDRIEPYHDRVRAAVVAHMDGARRAACHRAIAIALETFPDSDPEALVTHWRGAGDAEQGARYAVRAGDRAAEALAFDRAAAWYEQALAIRPPAKAEEHRALLVKIGEARANAGLGKLAADAFRAAAKGADAAQALDLRRRAAEQLLRSGNFDKGLEAALAVGREVGMRMPQTPRMVVALLIVLRVWLLIRGLGFRRRDDSRIAPEELTRLDMWWSLTFSLLAGDTVKGSTAAVQQVLLALRLGEPRRVARALGQQVLDAALGGGPAWARTRRIMERAQPLVEQCGDAHTEAWVMGCDACAHYMTGQYAEALRICDAAEEIFRTKCVGVAWELDTMHLFACNSLTQLGRLAEVQTRVTKHLQGTIDRGDLFGSVNLRIGFANMRWLAADDPASARRDVSDAMSEWSKQGVHMEHFYELYALTNIDLYEGRGDDALARFDQRWPALQRSFLPWRIQSIRIYCRWMHGRAALASGSAQGAREAVRDARRIEREAMPWSDPLAKLLRAGAAARDGHSARAIELARAAAVGFEAVDMRLHAASARRMLGGLLGGDEGRAQSEQADAWMASQGIKCPEKMAAVLAPGFKRSSKAAGGR